MTVWEKVLAVGSILFSVASALWGLWKKVIKPIIGYVKEYELLKKNASKIIEAQKRMDYLDKKLDSLIYLRSTPMLVCDDQGLCLMANHAALELFGARNEAQMKGLGFIQFIKPSDRNKLEDDLRINIKSGAEDFKNHYRIIHGDTEEEIEIMYHLMIGRDESNEVLVSMAKVTKV